MVICLERGADLHMAQLMPLPLTVSCFSKIQIGFTFLVLAHLGSPGKRAVKRVCVCVCIQKIQSRHSCDRSVGHTVEAGWCSCCGRLTDCIQSSHRQLASATQTSPPTLASQSPLETSLPLNLSCPSTIHSSDPRTQASPTDT